MTSAPNSCAYGLPPPDIVELKKHYVEIIPVSDEINFIIGEKIILFTPNATPNTEPNVARVYCITIVREDENSFSFEMENYPGRVIRKNKDSILPLRLFRSVKVIEEYERNLIIMKKTNTRLPIDLIRHVSSYLGGKRKKEKIYSAKNLNMDHRYISKIKNMYNTDMPKTKTRKGSSRKKGGYTRKRGGGFFKKNSWFWNKRKINVNGKNWNQMNDDAKRVYCWNHYKGSSQEKPGYHYAYDSVNNKCAMLPTNEEIKNNYEIALNTLCSEKATGVNVAIKNGDCPNDESTIFPADYNPLKNNLPLSLSSDNLDLSSDNLDGPKVHRRLRRVKGKLPSRIDTNNNANLNVSYSSPSSILSSNFGSSKYRSSNASNVSYPSFSSDFGSADIEGLPQI